MVCAVPDGVEIYGSEQHLYQVMNVLLDSTLKYSAPGSMVSVDLVSNGRNCVLSVTSPGEPISKEDLKNIFKRIFRADKANAMNGSYGFGLFIVESLVEANKGKIWAESKNGYITFFVQLPTNNRILFQQGGGISFPAAFVQELFTDVPPLFQLHTRLYP